MRNGEASDWTETRRCSYPFWKGAGAEDALGRHTVNLRAMDHMALPPSGRGWTDRRFRAASSPCQGPGKRPFLWVFAPAAGRQHRQGLAALLFRMNTSLAIRQDYPYLLIRMQDI